MVAEKAMMTVLASRLPAAAVRKPHAVQPTPAQPPPAQPAANLATDASSKDVYDPHPDTAADRQQQQLHDTSKVGEEGGERVAAKKMKASGETDVAVVGTAVSLVPERLAAEALQAIPRMLRLMYLHAWQSYVWNSAASHRLQVRAATCLVGAE
jgi:hypothetical protein